jgi:signal transduction histidine kinase
MHLQSITNRAGSIFPRIARLLPRTTIIVWVLAAIAAAGVGRVFGLPERSALMLIGALLVCVLCTIGEVAAISLDENTLLSPVPALLICGLSMTDWPLLIVAIVVGTILAGVIRQRSRRAVAEAGGRVLAIALIAPIDMLTRIPDALPFDTLPGLVRLPLVGLVVYLIEIAIDAFESGESIAQRWRSYVRTRSWYALAMVMIGGILGHLWRVGPLAFVPGLVTLALNQHLFHGQVELHRASRELEELADRYQERGERLERLQALATAMIGTLDLSDMLHLLCGRLAALMNAPFGWVALLDQDNELRLMACHNLAMVDSASEQPFVNPESYNGVMRRGRVVLMTDEYRHDLTPISARDSSGSWSTVLSIPLVAEQRVLGVICLAFEHFRGLDADEQRVLSAFAHQAAIVVENARLFDELRHKQAELIQSSKLAAVGTFAAGIAHEFNNLLGSMLGYAELAANSDDVDEKNSSLDVVIQACRRGRSITRGLLTFARRQENHRTLADVTDAVNETLTLVELDLRNSNIDVVRQIEPVPMTICDLGQLSQVVLNLITNGRDAMKPNGGTLTIRLRERNGMIEFSVSDTGCGIASNIRDKVFEPFVTTKGALGGSQTPGTGLGLSVSYGIVQEHNGTIQVESEINRGTTMTVHLPIITKREELVHAA